MPTCLFRFFPVAALALCAVAPTLAQVNAGNIEFVAGDATLRSVTGASRPATRGAAIAQGDSIETAQGRVQLRMADGAFISLQPQTLLRVEQYRLAGSGTTEELGLLGLLRGGLRTVTGSIGRVNRAGYRLTTPTATIGIRGTAFSVSADLGTRLSVSEGIAALCNSGGCLDVSAGQSGFAPDLQSRPVLAFQGPRLPPVVGDAQAAFLVAENRDDLGQSRAVPISGSGAAVAPTPIPVVPLPNGSGGAAIATVPSAGVFSAGLLGGAMVFDGTGALSSFTDCCFSGNNFAATTIGDFGADGIIAWGRWSSGNRGSQGIPQLAVHYVAVLSANAPVGPSIIGTYNVFASTAPTISSGGALIAVGSPNTVSGSINVNFPNLVSGGSLTYNLAIPVAAQIFTVNGSANQFSGTGFLGAASTINSSGAGCTPSCVGNIPFGNAIQGVFTGAAAQRAGINYGFTSTLGQVTGAAVLKP